MITTNSETALIASVFDDPKAFAHCSQFIGLEHFSHPELAAAWGWLGEMFAKSAPLSEFAMCERYRNHRLFPAYEETMSKGKGGTVGYAHHYAEELLDLWRLRKTVSTQQRVLERALRATSFRSVKPEIEAALMEVLEEGGKTDVEHIEKPAARVLDALQNPGPKKRRFRTGFPKLDSMIAGGIGEKHLVIIAGRTGGGKTTLAMNILTNMADDGVPCGVFSLEMDSDDLATRAALSISRRCTDAVDAFQKIGGLPIWVTDHPDRTADSIRAAMRLMVLRHGIKVVMVDYLQLIGAGPTRDNRERQVADMSRTLKLAAKENAVAVIALSQVNESHQLRESRAIEQDADGVLYITSSEDEYFLWLTKNRHGASHGNVAKMEENAHIDGIKVRFDKQNFRFTE